VDASLNPSYDPGEINFNPYFWRPVLAKIATKEEIERSWTLMDLADAHEALDVQLEIEYFSRAANK